MDYKTLLEKFILVVDPLCETTRALAGKKISPFTPDERHALLKTALGLASRSAEAVHPLYDPAGRFMGFE